MNNQHAIPFDTAASAYTLSNALVAEARAHVDAMLSSEAWMRENRQLWHPSGEWAMWRVQGNNLLSLPEQYRLRNFYLKSGWTKVEYIEVDERQPGRWVLRFYL